MLKKIRNSFFAGLLIIAPLFVTTLVIMFLADKINDIILDPMTRVFRPFIEHTYILLLVKLSAFLIVVLFVAFVGIATRNLFTKRFIHYIESWILRIPIANVVYSTTKEIRDALTGHKSKMFKEVVLVEYPRKGIYAIGFVASEAKGEMQDKTQQHVLNVFVPTSPNPTTGVVVLVPKEDVTYLHMTVEQGLKFVVSCGAISPENITRK